MTTNYVVFKYYFDPDKFEVQTRVIHPSRLLFDNERDITDGLNWLGEMITETAANIVEKFPDKKEEIKKLVAGQMGSEITYTEFWTDELVVWRLNKLILGKSRNPNFNYGNDNKKKGKKKASFDTKNFFDRPQMPYIAVNFFDLGETISGETSMINKLRFTRWSQ